MRRPVPHQKFEDLPEGERPPAYKSALAQLAETVKEFSAPDPEPEEPEDGYSSGPSF